MNGAPEPPLWEQQAELPRGERLQKVLAATGWGSRRVCEELIAAGRVRVNGEVAVLGRRVDPDTDLIEVDGAPVGDPPGLVYYLLNKPAGVVTTARDTHGRPTVVELVPTEPRVFPVGRLDADTEGLLLLTNDGELANRVAHPSMGVDKEYLAEVEVGRRTRRQPGGDPRAARRRRARRRTDGPGQGDPAVARSAADHHPRRSQPPGPADVRGGRPPGAPPRPRAHRPAHRSAAAARRVAPAGARRGPPARRRDGTNGPGRSTACSVRSPGMTALPGPR